MTVYTDFLGRFVLVLVATDDLERCFRIVDILAAGTLSFARVVYYLVEGSSEGLSRILQTVSGFLRESPCSLSVLTPWESIKVPTGTSRGWLC
jgi:hypothetical protein